MSAGKREIAELGHRLSEELRRRGDEFALHAFAEEATDVRAEDLHAAAESLYERVARRVVSDGEVTATERDRLDALGRCLEIDHDRRASLEHGASVRAYRAKLEEAREDDVVTDEEREELRALRQALGLQTRKEAAAATPDEPAFPAVGILNASESERRRAMLDFVESSPEFTTSDSPARLRRVPGIGNEFVTVLYIPAALPAVVGLSCLITLPAVLFGSVDVGLRDALTSVVLGPLLVAPLACLIGFRKAINRWLDRSEIRSRAAVVVGRRGRDGKKLASFVDRSGERFELPVCEDVDHSLAVGDAGVLFVRKVDDPDVLGDEPRDTVMDFDCVLTEELLHEPHLLGAVACSACESLYHVENVPRACENCGRTLPRVDAGPPLDLAYVKSWRRRARERRLVEQNMIHPVPRPTMLERVGGPVTCGWCRTRHERRPDDPNCPLCGGVLPMPPGAELGDGPPAPPRHLTWAFTVDLLFRRRWNWSQLKVLLFILVIPLINFFGVYIVLEDLFAALRQLRAYKRGVPTKGTVERVERLGHTRPESTDDYRILYRFEADGRLVRGEWTSPDPALVNYFPGESIWVLHVPSRPDDNAIWPPFA